MEVTVVNNRTGERGVVISFWYNCGNQLVLNVRSDGMATSWLAVNVTVLEAKNAA